MAISSLSIAQGPASKKSYHICMLDLRNIFYVHDSFFESHKIVMICSLNLDLSSEAISYSQPPLTTQLTLLNKIAG
jgi:hypothetical protein